MTKETLTFRGKEHEQYLTETKKLLITRNQLEREKSLIEKNLKTTCKEIKRWENWLIQN